jgi:hypothetical protein
MLKKIPTRLIDTAGGLIAASNWMYCLNSNTHKKKNAAGGMTKSPTTHATIALKDTTSRAYKL